MTKLEKIIAQYTGVEYNKDNYSIGGGNVDGKFASNRHEDASCDPGKLTVGKATAIFKKATGEDTDYVKAIIHDTFPFMEWHHASYFKGRMMKTYFLNSDQIIDLASNWIRYCQSYDKRMYS